MLVENLETDDLKFTHGDLTAEEQFNLVCKMGVFPYDFLNNMDRFQDIALLNRVDFYDKLNYSVLLINISVHVWYG